MVCVLQTMIIWFLNQKNFRLQPTRDFHDLDRWIPGHVKKGSCHGLFFYFFITLQQKRDLKRAVPVIALQRYKEQKYFWAQNLMLNDLKCGSSCIAIS